MISINSKKKCREELLKKWESELLKWKQSSLTQPVYCKREDLSVTQFYYWRAKINKLKGISDKSQPLSIPGIVKAGKIGFTQMSRESESCHMRLCFDDYCLELKDGFSSLSLSRLIKTLQGL